MGRVLLISLLLISSAVAANASVSRAAEAPSLTDYDQQALYVVKLGLSYVEWPRLVYSDNIKNIDICIIGDSPSFIKSLQNFQTAAAKKLKINIINRGDDSLSNCNIAYVTRNKTNFKDIIAKARNLPVLTVSPINGFAASGGMIELSVKEVSADSGGAPVNTKVTVTLIINNKSASAAGIKIADELLESAAEVIR